MGVSMLEMPQNQSTGNELWALLTSSLNLELGCSWDLPGNKKLSKMF